MNKRPQMKDCLERKSFESEKDAQSFAKWFQEYGHFKASVFQCQRCDRWHLASTPDAAASAKRRLQKTRCISDRDLHLALARQAGCSLDELQTRLDLTKVKLSGPNVEMVYIKKNKKPWD